LTLSRSARRVPVAARAGHRIQSASAQPAPAAAAGHAPWLTTLTGSTPGRAVGAGRVTDVSSPAGPSVPLPADGVSVGGAGAAGGGVSPFFLFGVAALLALAVVVVPGVIWTLAAIARVAVRPPLLALRERPG
jgi:hypothetical protein